MAEEDLIFGQKRHLFGGIAPGNMRKFEFRSPINHEQIGDSTGQLIAVLPDHTVIDGQVVCSVAGAVIRRKRNGYPINEFDGEKVADISTSQILKIKDYAIESAQAWYYSAFPYSTQGVYNRNSENRCVDIGECTEDLPYGYDVDLNDIDPATRVSYPPEVRNYGWVPAADLNNVGQHWTKAAFMPHPGVMRSDTNTFILAGEMPDKFENLSYPKFDFLMQWPLLYVKRTVENGVYKFRVFHRGLYSEIGHASLIEKGYDCWNNYDGDNNIANHFYTSIYPITQVIGKDNKTKYYMSHPSPNEEYFDGVTSFTHQSLINANSAGMNNYRSTDRLVDIDLMFDLLTMMFKTTNLSGVMYNSSRYNICTDIGRDITDGSGVSDLLYLLIDNPFGCYYSETDRKFRTRIFGMYNLFDDRMITGLVSYRDTTSTGGPPASNAHIYTKFTPNTKDGSSGTDFNYRNKDHYYRSAGYLYAVNGYIANYNYNPLDYANNSGCYIGRSPVGLLDGVAGLSDNLYCEHNIETRVDYIPVLSTDDKKHYIKFVDSFSRGYKFGLSIKKKGL